MNLKWLPDERLIKSMHFQFSFSHILLTVHQIIVTNFVFSHERKKKASTRTPCIPNVFTSISDSWSIHKRQRLFWPKTTTNGWVRRGGKDFFRVQKKKKKKKKKKTLLRKFCSQSGFCGVLVNFHDAHAFRGASHNGCHHPPLDTSLHTTVVLCNYETENFSKIYKTTYKNQWLTEDIPKGLGMDGRGMKPLSALYISLCTLFRWLRILAVLLSSG